MSIYWGELVKPEGKGALKTDPTVATWHRVCACVQYVPHLCVYVNSGCIVSVLFVILCMLAV